MKSDDAPVESVNVPVAATSPVVRLTARADSVFPAPRSTAHPLMVNPDAETLAEVAGESRPMNGAGTPTGGGPEPSWTICPMTAAY